MKILLGTHYLAKTGGTECYTYAIAQELIRRGHEVEYYAIVKGDTSKRLEAIGAKPMNGSKYDLILANHTTIVPKVSRFGYTIQTCHGVIPDLEQPSPLANEHVAVSQEVAYHLKSKGFTPIAIIHNGIDCERFKPTNDVSNNLQTVLSLCQGERAHNFVRRCCEIAGYNFIKADKFKDNVWDIERLINQADLVVGLGRSIYDAMACGRAALIYDFRDYYGRPYADGMVTPESIAQSICFNCNGKALNRAFNEQTFIAEMQKYNQRLAAWSRQYVVENLDIKKSVDKYLECYEGA